MAEPKERYGQRKVDVVQVTDLSAGETAVTDSAAELIKQVDREVRECVKCELSQNRNKAVPGEGSITARVMFVGEAPGKEEDLQGRPFVGMAGRLLSELLSSIGLRREDVYITNIVKCRPPENRPPHANEISACSNYLERQIRLVNPRLLCPMGNVALKVFLQKDAAISKVHGKVVSRMEGRGIFPLYHPAAALYVARLKTTLQEDVRNMAKELG